MSGGKELEERFSALEKQIVQISLDNKEQMAQMMELVASMANSMQAKAKAEAETKPLASSGCVIDTLVMDPKSEPSSGCVIDALVMDPKPEPEPAKTVSPEDKFDGGPFPKRFTDAIPQGLSGEQLFDYVRARTAGDVLKWVLGQKKDVWTSLEAFKDRFTTFCVMDEELEGMSKRS